MSEPIQVSQARRVPGNASPTAASVRGCNECPFVHGVDTSFPACEAPGTGTGLLFEGHDDDDHAPDPPLVAPDWCPLRLGTITVSLEESV